MKKILGSGLLSGILILWAVTMSYGAPVDVMMSKNDAELGPSDGTSLADQTISFTGLNPNATSAATITFSVLGDFDFFIENIVLSVDGFSFGTWLNDNNSDDIIDGADNIGNQYAFPIKDTATVPLVNLTPLLLDGQLDFLFDYSPSVTDFIGAGFIDLAQVRVQYEAAMSPVPTPSAMLLVGTGLVGMIGWNYRRTKKS